MCDALYEYVMVVVVRLHGDKNMVQDRKKNKIISVMSLLLYSLSLVMFYVVVVLVDVD